MREETVRLLLDAGLARVGDRWFLEQKTGERTYAVLTPEGALEIGGVSFRSPSSAARTVLGTSTNGWKRWKYQEGDSEVTIDSLRQALLLLNEE